MAGMSLPVPCPSLLDGMLEGLWAIPTSLRVIIGIYTLSELQKDRVYLVIYMQEVIQS